MSHRSLTLVVALVLLAALLSGAPLSGAGQSPATGQKPAPKAAQPRFAPKTAWGDPDLQGMWDFRTITPMERPLAFGDKQFLSAEEAAELEQLKAAFEAADVKARQDSTGATAAAEAGKFNTFKPGIGDPVGAYGSEWYDTGSRVVPSKRTSLIVDPADGRIPYTPEGRQRNSRPRHTDGPEGRSLSERCLVGLNAGPPMRPHAYNNNAHIFQAPGYVAILNEMIHDVRIIPLDRRPHISPIIRQWMGDSRGRWEGQTLVVETTNFDDRANFSGATESMRLVERFTRVGPDALDYEFTVTDPKAFSRPWTSSFQMIRSNDKIYEYACHEGNHGMEGILRGARAEERAAAQKSQK